MRSLTRRPAPTRGRPCFLSLFVSIRETGFESATAPPRSPQPMAEADENEAKSYELAFEEAGRAGRPRACGQRAEVTGGCAHRSGGDHHLVLRLAGGERRRAQRL